MYYHTKKAFSMLELIIVIIIIGILSTIAISKLYINKDDAIITKAKNTLSSVRASMANEKQKRILNSNFTKISSLNTNNQVFGGFDGDFSHPVLDYGVINCTSSISTACWTKSNDNYIFILPDHNECKFKLSDNRLVTLSNNPTICDKLER